MKRKVEDFDNVRDETVVFFGRVADMTNTLAKNLGQTRGSTANVEPTKKETGQQRHSGQLTRTRAGQFFNKARQLNAPVGKDIDAPKPQGNWRTSKGM